MSRTSTDGLTLRLLAQINSTNMILDVAEIENAGHGYRPQTPISDLEAKHGAVQ